MSRSVVHAAGGARRAESAPFAGQRHQQLVAARGAAHPRKPVREDERRKRLTGSGRRRRRRGNARTPPRRTGAGCAPLPRSSTSAKKVFRVRAHGRVQKRALGLAPPVTRPERRGDRAHACRLRSRCPVLGPNMQPRHDQERASATLSLARAERRAGALQIASCREAFWYAKSGGGQGAARGESLPRPALRRARGSLAIERSAGLTVNIVYDILPRLGEDHLPQNGGRGEPAREIPCAPGLERARRSGRRAEGNRDFRPARSRG
jgi:hypothetical protein